MWRQAGASAGDDGGGGGGGGGGGAGCSEGSSSANAGRTSNGEAGGARRKGGGDGEGGERAAAGIALALLLSDSGGGGGAFPRSLPCCSSSSSGNGTSSSHRHHHSYKHHPHPQSHLYRHRQYELFGRGSTDADSRKSICYVLDVAAPPAGGRSPSFCEGGKINIDGVREVIRHRLQGLRWSESQPYGFYKFEWFVSCKHGPKVVEIDKQAVYGSVSFGRRELVVEGQANFSTVEANARVFDGKWMYEVTLGTSGIQQLGWATGNCPFNSDDGVGDVPNSYAFDGKRGRKWSPSSPQLYGQPWANGDVIGCCIDLELGEISFYRNGVSMGVAFSQVRTEYAYFPAVSILHGERCELNFGGRPFRYPVEGFAPLQEPPLVALPLDPEESLRWGKLGLYGSATAQAQYLLECLRRLVRARKPGRGDLGGDDGSPSFSSSSSSSSSFCFSSSSCSSASVRSSIERLTMVDPLESKDVLSVAGAICVYLSPLLTGDVKLAANQLNSKPERKRWEGAPRARSRSSVGLCRDDFQLLYSVSYDVWGEPMSSSRRGAVGGGAGGLPGSTVLSSLSCSNSKSCRGYDDGAVGGGGGVASAAAVMTSSSPSSSSSTSSSSASSSTYPGLEYVIWATLVPFLLETLGPSPPHDGDTLDNVVSLLLRCLDSVALEFCIPEIFEALAYGCRTSSLVPRDYPYTGAYKYLALACRLVKSREVMERWWRSPGFDVCLEGLLTRKTPNKVDLEGLFPVVWWHGTREECCSETKMKQAMQGLGSAMKKVEELHVELCRSIIDFVPRKEATALCPLDGERTVYHRGDVFHAFLGQLVLKNRGANRNIPPAGLSDNCVLVSVYLVLLHLLTEGSGAVDPTNQTARGSVASSSSGGSAGGNGFLRRGGRRCFPVRLLLDYPQCYDLPRLGGTFSHLSKVLPTDPSHMEDIEWEEDPGDEEEEEEGEGEGAGRLDDVKAGESGVVSRESEAGEVHNGYCLAGTRGHGFRRSSAENGRYGSVREQGGGMPLQPSNSTGLQGHLHNHRESSQGHLENVVDNGGGRGGGRSRGGPVRLRAAEERYGGSCTVIPSSGGQTENCPNGPEQARASGSLDGLCGIREEELLDTMVLLYHLGMASNFKQANLYLQNQMLAISHLDESDRNLQEIEMTVREFESRPMSARNERNYQQALEYRKNLKVAKVFYREDAAEYVRQFAWYRVLFFSPSKQHGMYATCIYIVQLLLAASKRERIFSYVPEFYVEALMDSFHALRRSDPPVVPPAALMRKGLSPMATFLVMHFNDARIANPDVRDALLQSISVLLQYKEYMAAFEASRTARESMVGALLEAFDNRFWIPVSSILLRLCKGGGFGASNAPSSHGGGTSPLFQRLLQKKCTSDEKLFASFLNRLFNMLTWTVMEFSVAMKEVQDVVNQRTDTLQRRCIVMFELSCNMERVLEFLTLELPHVFLCGSEMNLTRLCELLIFVLKHTATGPGALLFDRSLMVGVSSMEKVNPAHMLAPLVGIVLNLASASSFKPRAGYPLCIARALAAADVSGSCLEHFDYLLQYNWTEAFPDDSSLKRLPELKLFAKRLKLEIEELKHQATKEEERREWRNKRLQALGPLEGEEVEVCTICCWMDIDTIFLPCKHRSCRRCISRHLLNNKRCFFCNAFVEDLSFFTTEGSCEEEMGKKVEEDRKTDQDDDEGGKSVVGCEVKS
ncbi:hypothetical protein CBR_g4334 [Chara braunii]|uniref:B30.2/SPRY domain-containing protein n=1 Tax=Chara braunii TaxID=69332 RepID=A0A388JRE1_CHABU|nr:hypothetical protein CBR_g4334 [Chara braunii]|eukprot:GBG60376.1 hypothetical protein CBR_g4334 [Chara braunii]